MADEILPHTRRAFCTMGHGCDVIPDQIPGQPEVELPEYRVPAGCIFVTVEVCGRYSSTMEVSKIFEAFQDPLLKEALKYPDNDKIWKVLHDYLQIEADENSVLRVRTEGQLFTNPFIYLWSNFDKNSYYSQSGVYELGKIPLLKDGRIRQMDWLQMNPNELEIAKVRELKPTDLSYDSLEYAYHGSIFPTAAEISGGMSIQYRYLDLMNARPGPGVYYHFACRSPCDILDYDPQFNYKTALDAATSSAPNGSINQTKAIEKVKIYHETHMIKHPVIKMMRQRSMNLAKPGQKGLNEKYIIQKPVKILEMIDDWRSSIRNRKKRYDWYKIIIDELQKIIAIHAHALILTIWLDDIVKVKKCSICGGNFPLTYCCIQDDYHECENCYYLRQHKMGAPAALEGNVDDPLGRRRQRHARMAAKVAVTPLPVKWMVSDRPETAEEREDSLEERKWQDMTIQKIAAANKQYRINLEPDFKKIYNMVPLRRGGRRTKRKTHRKKANRRIRKQTRKTTR